MSNPFFNPPILNLRMRSLSDAAKVEAYLDQTTKEAIPTR